MFLKVKNTILVLLLTIFIMPLNSLAYSDYIIASGENIGIKLNSKGVVIVGTYKIEERNPGEDAGLKVGDIITHINDNSINNVDDMVSIINNQNNDEIKIKYLRQNKSNVTSLKLSKDNNTYKTGLWVMK